MRIDHGSFPDEETNEAKLRLLRVAGWFLLAGPALFISLIVLIHPDQAQRGLGPAVVLILAAANLMLLRAGKARSAARMLVYGTLAGLIPAVMLNGGLQAPQTAALPLVILLAGWLLGGRHAIVLTALSLAFVLGLAAYPAGLQPPPLQPILSVLPLVVVLLITGMLTSYIVRSNDDRLSEVRRLGEALAAEKSQLAQIAENVPAMIFHGDRELICRYANSHFADFFQGGGMPVEGMHLRDILGDAMFEATLPNIERVLAGESVLLEGERKSVSGSLRHLEISLVPDRGGDGAVVGFYALKRDVTERQNTERALAESEARLREAQRIGRFGSWELDLLSKRLHWTDELFKIYECDPAAFGGTWDALLKMVHPDDLAVIRTAFRESADGRGAYEIDHRILTPDGHIKHLHVRWEVFFDPEGKPVRALGTAQDITEQTLAKAEIQRLNDELETRVRERTAELQAANKELESFAYSISHDLRAPLRGIDGFSQLLLDEYREKLDEQGRGYLDRVRRAAQRMGTLIDDILELSRVSRHAMRRDEVDLSRLGHEILDDLGRAAPQRRVEVQVAPGCSAVGDPQLLRVMMQNLLENAWKYTGRTEAACIEFGCEMVDGKPVFHVRDNGVGFDMQYANRLFSPFQRLHSPEEFEGTGIGLATVARVVHRHGGRVWAESAVGEGATFRFTLRENEI